MVFGRFSGLIDFSPIPVAISRQACRVLATLAALVITACATPPVAVAPAVAPLGPEARQALVTERVKARWDAMIKDDLDVAYTYMSPGSRAVTSLEKYKANTRRGAFRAVRIESVSCEGDACTVQLFLTYDHPRMKGITTPITESWIIDGVQAWYVYTV